eukprot:scaffold2437_cov395-Prasinococcus_capsulatus_cf.AAC.14
MQSKSSGRRRLRKIGDKVGQNIHGTGSTAGDVLVSDCAQSYADIEDDIEPLELGSLASALDDVSNKVRTDTSGAATKPEHEPSHKEGKHANEPKKLFKRRQLTSSTATGSTSTSACVSDSHTTAEDDSCAKRVDLIAPARVGADRKPRSTARRRLVKVREMLDPPRNDSFSSARSSFDSACSSNTSDIPGDHSQDEEEDVFSSPVGNAVQVESNMSSSPTEGTLVEVSARIQQSIPANQSAEPQAGNDAHFYASRPVSSATRGNDDAGAGAHFDIVLDDGAFHLTGEAAYNLYPHQREGLKWLWSLHKKQSGGILGDDMGLGKTRQVCSYLAGLWESKAVTRAMIVAPKTLLGHWAAELRTCGLGGRIRQYFGASDRDKEHGLSKISSEGGVLLTTYGMILHNFGKLTEYDAEELQWDYMFLDEGHKIKNPKMQLYIALKEIMCKHRIILTGTPIQNNLKELWALFDFACPDLFGEYQCFRDAYERPIADGLAKDASQRQKHVGHTMALQLQERYGPFFLRRLKKEIFKVETADEPVDTCDKEGAPSLGSKNDFIVWVRLSQPQQRLYRSFLMSQEVRNVLNKSNSALAALTVLKKICDHPKLLRDRLTSDSGDEPSTRNETQEEETWELVAHAARQKSNIEQSAKISFVVALLEHLIADSHRTLIFSQSKKMLDCFEEEFDSRGWTRCRIDGSMGSAEERHSMVDRFRLDVSIPIFLLTSQVGGLGLTLTEADRVIIVDPAWNPAVDNQSVDRVYRIGQQRHVVIYRLITSGTVEEKIYRKQVYKGGLSKAATQQDEQFRYFSNQELKDLFQIGNMEQSETQCQLEDLHGGQRKGGEQIRRHVEVVTSLPNSLGVSDNDLLFTQKVEQTEAPTGFAAQPTRPSRSGGSRSAKKDSNRYGVAHWSCAPTRGSGSLLERALSGLKLRDDCPGDLSRRFSGVQDDEDLKAQKRLEEADRNLASIQAALARHKSHMNDEKFVNRLPDKGEKILMRVAELEDQLRGAQDELSSATRDCARIANCTSP